MARKTTGARYPFATTDARQHDHTWCAVIGAIAASVASGAEPWGTPHRMPPLESADQAARIRQGLFRGRSCPQLRRQHGELSVSVTYHGPDRTLTNSPVTTGDKYVLVVRVWSRDHAKREIARRANAGEPLPYNVMRG